jgi:hypothetical protein
MKEKARFINEANKTILIAVEALINRDTTIDYEIDNLQEHLGDLIKEKTEIDSYIKSLLANQPDFDEEALDNFELENYIVNEDGVFKKRIDFKYK